MSDLLFRGGVRHGAHPPVWILRIAGAVLGLAIVQLASALGLWTALGLSPTVLRIVLAAIGAAVAPSSLGVVLWIAATGLGALLMVVLYTPLVVPLAPMFVRHDVSLTTAPPPDALIVLSGSISSEGLVNGAALERVISGLQEVQQRRIAAIALSVIAEDDREEGTTSERDQRALVTLMAPQSTLSFVRDVHSTRDEALAFAALARTRQWRRVVVVTSPLHSRRACRALEQAGLEVECHPSQSRLYALTRLDRPENRRLAFADVLYETAATLLYAVRGWTP